MHKKITFVQKKSMQKFVFKKIYTIFVPAIDKIVTLPIN
jgi:hypothetical protein